MATISEICWNLVYRHWTPCLLNITVIMEWKEVNFWQRNWLRVVLRGFWSVSGYNVGGKEWDTKMKFKKKKLTLEWKWKLKSQSLLPSSSFAYSKENKTISMSLVWIPKIAQIVTCCLALSWFLYLRIKAKAKDEISENINRAVWTFGVSESTNRAKKQTRNNVPFCKGTIFWYTPH